jgi:transcriptional regulator with XRE-family HTH domain
MPWLINGAALRERREKRGLSIVKLAEKVKVWEKTLRRLETGETEKVRGENLKSIAKALGCEMGDIAMFFNFDMGGSKEGRKGGEGA